MQLPKLKGFIEERAKWAAYYRDELSGVDWLSTPQEPENGNHGWQSFVTLVDPEKAPNSRNELMEILQEQGIATRPGTHAITMLNYYQSKYKLKATDFPGALACHNLSMAIPLHNRMVEDDYKYVVRSIKRISA